jgi:hypothetical protein
MKTFSSVVLNLQNPREKVWGILLETTPSGVTVKGIDLNSFDDWSRSVARGEDTMGLSTVFFPMHRVERINLDEKVGNIQSYAEIFESRVGEDPWSHLRLPKPTDDIRELSG